MQESLYAYFEKQASWRTAQTALTEKLKLGAKEIKGSEADRRDSRENKFRDTISSEQRCHVPPPPNTLNYTPSSSISAFLFSSAEAERELPTARIFQDWRLLNPLPLA